MTRRYLPVLGTDYAGGGIGLGPRPDPEVIPYPDPEITSDDSIMFAVRPPVASLARTLADHEWKVRITHARGRFPNGGRPGALKRSLAVRGYLPGTSLYGVAVYVEGTSSWTWGFMALRKPGYGQALFSGVGIFLEAALESRG